MKRFFIIFLILTALLTLLSSCQGDEPDVIVDIGGGTEAPTSPAQNTDAPKSTDGAATTAPTHKPDTIEARVLAGEIIRISDGGTIPLGTEADLDGDGVRETISMGESDGAPTVLVNGEAFMDAGARLYLASFDGKNIVILSEKEGRDGFMAFYPDFDGNLFCRLYAVKEHGAIEELVHRDSLEDYIKDGLDIMLFNPYLYAGADGDTRTVMLDMDGDGVRETITFSGLSLNILGGTDERITLTTMPRFGFDEDKNTIVLKGSAGDYVLKLFVENGALKSEMSWAKLL